MRFWFPLLIVFLFFARLLFGLSGEFWFEDELQIYLIGLQSFTQSTWAFYGPDIVYTNTQIPGALQGLLVSLPFYLLKIPEAPTIFLNLLSFLSLAFFARYIDLRVSGLPTWIIWVLLMLTPWSMNATRVVNPSYVLVFSIPFFIALWEVLPIYQTPLLKSSSAFFLMGACITLIMQLHMSWVLLVPLSGLGFLFYLRQPLRVQAKNIFYYLLGLLAGAATLVPTLLLPKAQEHELASNIVFHFENWKNIFTILARFLSFAAFEIPYMLGGSTAARLQVVREHIWMSPFTAFLFVMGFVQVIFFVVLLVIKKGIDQEFKKIRILLTLSILLVYFSFFFSVKGPSSHTFFVMFPLAMLYSFYAYIWLARYKNKMTVALLYGMLVSSVFFHLGLGLYNWEHRSLYRDRAKVEKALEKMDYRILGERRYTNENRIFK